MTGKKIPQRKCAGCQMMKDKKELLRLVKEADTGQIRLDPTGRKNGRGCYLCAKRECIEGARKSRGVERSLKCSIPVTVWEELLQKTENETIAE